MELRKSPDIPIVCTLSDEDFRRREREIIGNLMPRVTSVESMAEGSKYSFPSDAETLEKVLEFIRLERQCCPFLDFHLSIERTGPIKLSLTGPKGAKEFIEATFK
ncbi:hypothetical protein [Leptolyngbya sp. 7M]|uniref:hypothetical protein n=1 Tax=Leptolyngbya sp. 7M TaxID=2812896 RepID=UPI001B8C36F5|nr:hypothetical protein [Leptolyngbya sp. 7M]QYO64033.1 hypothetical protein JVX88_30300 [Leptolyngbya sp. 7M]